MRVVIQQSYELMSKWAAYYLVQHINEHDSQKPFVLGLPTGSTPLGMYRELITLCKAKKVSFRNVITFNMDEYVGLTSEHEQSYHRFMWDNFFLISI